MDHIIIITFSTFVCIYFSISYQPLFAQLTLLKRTDEGTISTQQEPLPDTQLPSSPLVSPHNSTNKNKNTTPNTIQTPATVLHTTYKFLLSLFLKHKPLIILLLLIPIPLIWLLIQKRLSSSATKQIADGTASTVKRGRRGRVEAQKPQSLLASLWSYGFRS